MMLSYYYENDGDDIQTTLMLGEEWLGVEPGGLDRRGVRQINMGVGVKSDNVVFMVEILWIIMTVMMMIIILA